MLKPALWIALAVSVITPNSLSDRVRLQVDSVEGWIETAGFTLSVAQANLECRFEVGRDPITQYPYQELRTFFEEPETVFTGDRHSYRLRIGSGTLDQRVFRSHAKSCAYRLSLEGYVEYQGRLQSVWGNLILAGGEQDITREELEAFLEDTQISEQVQLQLQPLVLTVLLPERRIIAISGAIPAPERPVKP